MCNCIRKVTEKVIDSVTKSRAAKGETILPLTYYKDGFQSGGYGIVSDIHGLKIPGARLMGDFVFQSTFRKKDGTTSKPKKNKIIVLFTHCPFCGIPYDGEPHTEPYPNEEEYICISTQAQ